MRPLPNSIDVLLTESVRQGASDIHIATGAIPKCRIYGSLSAISDYPVLSDRDTRRLLEPLLDAYARRELDSLGQFDLSYSIHNVGRFRVNIFKQKGAWSGVFRSLSSNVPAFEELGLPLALYDVTSLRRGLVLVTGITGSGKSTTLASLVDIINKTYNKHIITLEEPIEYLHWHDRSIVSQREVGKDVSSFALGLRAALREDPDVILVGEMRDQETMETALQAAETGHLVLSTLHTIGAAETVDRIINTFPESRHAQLRSQLASTLSCVVSQQLLPRCNTKGYALACELMFADKTVKRHILDGTTYELSDYLRETTATDMGMISMDNSIKRLYSKQAISRATAVNYALDKRKMERDLV